MQFLNAEGSTLSGSTQHPLITMIESLWQELSSLARGSICAADEVATGVSDVLIAALRGAGAGAVPLLGPCAQLLVGAVQAQPLQPGWLGAVSLIVELCGSSSSSDDAAQLASLVEAVGGAVMPAISSAGTAGCEYCIEAILDVGFRCVLFCPTVRLSDTLVPD